MFFIAYAFKGQVHVFAGRVKIVVTRSAGQVQLFKYFCPLQGLWLCPPFLLYPSGPGKP